MVSGDMPPPLPVEEPRGPCAPFWKPLKPSIRPITRLPYDGGPQRSRIGQQSVTGMWSKWHASSPSASGLRANDRPSPIASTLSPFMVVIFVGVILRLADFVAAAGAGRPIFPGPPGFRHVRLVAPPPRPALP